MKISIPEFSLIAFVGVSGSGKSSFGRKHFKPTEVVSSDACRALICDNDNDQSVTGEAFDLLYTIVSKRLTRKKLTVIDATNVQKEARKPILEMARKYHCLPIAIVFNLPEEACTARNKNRPDRNFGNHVIRNQASQLRKSLRHLKDDGFRYVYVLNSEEEVNNVEITRARLWTNKEDDHGPFDIIGDVHGCFDELVELLSGMGYAIDLDKIRSSEPAVHASQGRKAVFVGDLVDRGPESPSVLALAMNMVEHGSALCVPGNHDVKLVKYLDGRNVQMKHGLELTVEQLKRETDEFKSKARAFIDGLVSHMVFDDGKLVVAHAGMRADYQGRASGKVREFALYGETTGEIDEYGLPVRHPWAEDYRGSSMVVYGHTPVVEAEWLNNTICIDTGCVFGGSLTALRYPERELVSVKAKKVYYEPIKPLGAGAIPEVSSQHEHDDLLVLEDVQGKRIIKTRLRDTVTIREENSAAALEVMSRFAVNPKWLVHLPPTMSPSETTEHDGHLEYPTEALKYFRSNGVEKAIAQEKHMGSRALMVVCRDEDAARKRFGVVGEGIGRCYSRTGRAFFHDKKFEDEFLQRISSALTKNDFWTRLNTDWALLDSEIMPWSIKATELLKEQYAAVGAVAASGFAESIRLMEMVSAKTEGVASLLATAHERSTLIDDYRKSYRNYCWPFKSLDDLKVAPFHILATEIQVHTDKDHLWHMETIKSFAKEDPKVLVATRYLEIDLHDEASCSKAVAWWEELTGQGGEGMVVKPINYISFSKKGLVQPAVKCRGREYLRLIYGPEYTRPENLSRLRDRALSSKRSLALREFALGVEALERFVRKEPLRKVHECVFGILALESEPVDPRL